MGKGGKRKYHVARGDSKRFKGAVTSAVYQSCSRGVLISHDRTKENHCRNDAFRLFNYFADQWYGEENTNEDAKEEVKEEKDEFVDIEAALKAEMQVSRNFNKAVTRRFTSQKSGCNNIVFIQFNGLPDCPSVFIQKLLKTVEANKGDSNMPEGRALLRLHPVDKACKAMKEEIEKAVTEFVPQQLNKLADDMHCDVTKQYHVAYKCRNNGNLGMHLVTEAIVDVLREESPDWKWNCRSNDVMILIDIICATCSISVVSGYSDLKRFNLREIRTSDIPKEEKTKCNINTEEEGEPQNAAQETVQTEKTEENVLAKEEPQKCAESVQTDAEKAEANVQSGEDGPQEANVQTEDTKEDVPTEVKDELQKTPEAEVETEQEEEVNKEVANQQQK